MATRLSARYIGWGALVSLLTVLLVTEATALGSANIQLLRYGAWGLTTVPDPFLSKYPAVLYLPPGTVVFESKTGTHDEYTEILTHNGQRLQILDSISVDGASRSVLRPASGVISPPPSKGIMIHDSILCLAQTNRIAEASSKRTPQRTPPRAIGDLGIDDEGALIEVRGEVAG